jgi:hypothetical protein
MPRLSLVLAVTAAVLAGLPAAAAAQDLPSFRSTREVMVHGFRAPSIGLEYRHGFVGLHAGAYTSVLDTPGDAHWFVKAGATAYLLPVRLTSERHSSFYVSASLLRGLSSEFGNGAMAEAGFRWAAWRGLDLRLGVAVLRSGGKTFVNPTPGLSWSIAL